MGSSPLFQGSHEVCFDTVLALYGQDCTWEDRGVTDLAIFNIPTGEARFKLIDGRGLNHVGYNNGPITKPYIEYRQGMVFDGLFEKVYNQDLNQYLQVNGKRWVGTKAETFFDGETIHISLEEAITDAVIEQ